MAAASAVESTEAYYYLAGRDVIADLKQRLLQLLAQRQLRRRLTLSRRLFRGLRSRRCLVTSAGPMTLTVNGRLTRPGLR